MYSGTSLFQASEDQKHQHNDYYLDVIYIGISVFMTIDKITKCLLYKKNMLPLKILVNYKKAHYQNMCLAKLQSYS